MGTTDVNPFEKKFLEHLRRRKLAGNGDRVLVAVSGGPDSMALLSLFVAVCPVLRCHLAAAHANFGLRGEESDGDEGFVREVCGSLGITLHVRRFDTLKDAAASKRSLEETARIQRYVFFEELCVEHGYTRVATGHHASDNAETMLFNLFRGTGLTGFRGIRATNGAVVRPLLQFTRSEIIAYLEENDLRWRTDHTNLETVHDRNFIRHRVIPAIEERFGGKLMPSLQRLAEQAGELDEFIERHIARLLEEHALLDVKGGKLHAVTLLGLSLFERKEVLKRALTAQGGAVDGQVLQRLAELLERQPGRSVQAGRGVTVTKKDGFLVFWKR